MTNISNNPDMSTFTETELTKVIPTVAYRYRGLILSENKDFFNFWLTNWFSVKVKFCFNGKVGIIKWHWNFAMTSPSVFPDGAWDGSHPHFLFQNIGKEAMNRCIPQERKKSCYFDPSWSTRPWTKFKLLSLDSCSGKKQTLLRFCKYKEYI